MGRQDSQQLSIKKGDKVVVISGKDRGKTGEVLRVLPKQDKVVVKGVNIVTKHTKPTMQNQKGSLVKKEAPLFRAKVMLCEPNSEKGTRVGHKVQNDRKVRVSKKSGDALD